jgi:predicted amidohydrolase
VPGPLLPITLVQAAPTALEPLPGTGLVIFPELHVHAMDLTPEQQRDEAEPLDGPRVRQLAEIAGDLGIWLVPGSVLERGPNGELFNTALAFSPGGRLVAWYRKVFPWRPFEPYDPGDRFVVFDIPDVGRVGFSICYDAWFPEVARHLAWMGADLIVNPVRTTTPDRAQELVLARANAIVNQVFVASVNTAGPHGYGRSVLVDPEGHVVAEAPDAAPVTLTSTVDMTEVARVRREGTAGYNRMWEQFTENDRPVELPLYAGRIDPDRWRPRGGTR